MIGILSSWIARGGVDNHNEKYAMDIPLFSDATRLQYPVQQAVLVSFQPACHLTAYRSGWPSREDQKLKLNGMIGVSEIRKSRRTQYFNADMRKIQSRTGLFSEGL